MAWQKAIIKDKRKKVMMSINDNGFSNDNM